MPTFENKNGEILIDMSQARTITQCDGCKQSIDTSAAKKGKDGKATKPRNPAIQAELEASVDSDETRIYHFCDSGCLRDFLNRRFQK